MPVFGKYLVFQQSGNKFSSKILTEIFPQPLRHEMKPNTKQSVYCQTLKDTFF